MIPAAKLNRANKLILNGLLDLCKQRAAAQESALYDQISKLLENVIFENKQPNTRKIRGANG